MLKSVENFSRSSAAITRHNVSVAILEFNNRWNIKKGHLIFITERGGRQRGRAAINCSVMNAVLASIKTPALYDGGGSVPHVRCADLPPATLMLRRDRRPKFAVCRIAWRHKIQQLHRFPRDTLNVYTFSQEIFIKNALWITWRTCSPHYCDNGEAGSETAAIKDLWK